MNKSSLEELVDLRLDCLLSIRCETSQLLFDQFFIRLESYPMLDHLPGYSRHVERLPGQYVLVCSEEGDDRLFLFRVESYSV